MTKQLPDAFIFMKVGNHAGESFEAILARKDRARAQAGRIFWGCGAICRVITIITNNRFALRYPVTSNAVDVRYGC